MVANKELQPGEEIVTEMPFVVGPKAFTYPLCLSCYAPWPPSVTNKPLCSRCGWPVCSLVLLANRAYSAREISSTELASRLEEAGSLLKKSLTMLLLEPADTPEGKLAKRALQELKMLNQNIADVKTIITVDEKSSHDKKKPQRSKSAKNK